MNARGATALGVAAIAFAVVVGASTGPQTFSKVYVSAPLSGDGRGSATALKATLVVDIGEFGDGSDGDATIAANASLSRDTYYRNVTMPSTGIAMMKISGGDAWNAGASSQAFAGDGKVAWRPDSNSKHVMIGLSTTDPDANFTSIGYAAYCANDGTFQVYELGVYKGNHGTYATNDLINVERVGTTITYSVNGIVRYTSATASTGTIRIDSSLYSHNAIPYALELTVAGVLTPISWTNIIGVTFGGAPIFLNTNGFRLFVSGTLTWGVTAKIGRDGNSATPTGSFGCSVPGAALALGSLPGAQRGGTGSFTGGVCEIPSGSNPAPTSAFSRTAVPGDGNPPGAGPANGANGGIGQGGAGGGGSGRNGCGVGAAVFVPTAGDIGDFFEAKTGFGLGGAIYNGSSGGGGGGGVGSGDGCSGSGGGAGGYVVAVVHDIIGGGTFTAVGGAGGNALAASSGVIGGGGGGSGGEVVLETTSSASNYLIDVSGGSGGIQAGGVLGAGGQGGSGVVEVRQVIVQ